MKAKMTLLEFAEKFYNNKKEKLQPWQREMIERLQANDKLVICSQRTGKISWYKLNSEYNKYVYEWLKENTPRPVYSPTVIIDDPIVGDLFIPEENEVWICPECKKGTSYNAMGYSGVSCSHCDYWECL